MLAGKDELLVLLEDVVCLLGKSSLLGGAGTAGKRGKRFHICGYRLSHPVCYIQFCIHVTIPRGIARGTLFKAESFSFAV